MEVNNIMDDKELLAMAKRHEKFLIRLDNGEIETALKVIISRIDKNNPASVLIAQVMAAFKAYIFENNIEPDLLEIRKAENMLS